MSRLRGLERMRQPSPDADTHSEAPQALSSDLRAPDPLARLGPNALAGIASRLVQMAVSLLITGFVVRVLGAEQWAVVVLATSTAALLSVLQVGAALGIAKRLTSLAAAKRWEEYERYFTASEVLSFLLVAVLVVAVAALLGPAWSLVGAPGDAEIRLVVALAAVPVAATFLQLPAIGALQSAHRLDLVAGTTTRAFLLRSSAMVAGLLLIAPRAWVYALVAAGESVLALVLFRYQARRVAPSARTRITPHLLRDLLSITGFNLALAFNSAVYAAFLQMPVFFLQRLSGTQSVAAYGVLIQVNNAARAFFVAGTTALGPVANTFVALNDRTSLRSLFVRSTEVFVTAAVLTSSWLIAFRSDLLHLWLGAPSTELISGMPAFVVATGFGIAAMPAAVVSTALEELRIPAATGVVLAGIMALALTHVRPATALFDANLALAVGFGAYQLVRVATVSRLLAIPVRKLAGSVGARTVIVGTVASAGLFVPKSEQLGRLGGLVLGSAAWLTLALVALTVVLTAEERRWILERGRSVSRRWPSFRK